MRSKGDSVVTVEHCTQFAASREQVRTIWLVKRRSHHPRPIAMVVILCTDPLTPPRRGGLLSAFSLARVSQIRASAIVCIESTMAMAPAAANLASFPGLFA